VGFLIAAVTLDVRCRGGPLFEDQYHIVSMHLHAPSEHQLNGKVRSLSLSSPAYDGLTRMCVCVWCVRFVLCVSCVQYYPLELHIVHQARGTMDLAVVAVFFEEGPYSEFLAEYEYPIHDVRLTLRRLSPFTARAHRAPPGRDPRRAQSGRRHRRDERDTTQRILLRTAPTHDHHQDCVGG
jgi:hypothetical protein